MRTGRPLGSQDARPTRRPDGITKRKARFAQNGPGTDDVLLQVLGYVAADVLVQVLGCMIDVLLHVPGAIAGVERLAVRTHVGRWRPCRGLRTLCNSQSLASTDGGLANDYLGREARGTGVHG